MSRGIHHITAVAGDPQRNYNFYTHLLGMRLVKKTVNYDDPSVYHLYYGDRTGRPGSVLTFFPWSRLKQGEPDRGQAVAVALAVPEGSLSFWAEYLDENDINFMEPFDRFGKKVLGLQDPDGLHLELVEDTPAGDKEGWGTRRVPAEHAVRYIRGVTLAEDSAAATARLLTEVLGFEESGRQEERTLYTAGEGAGAAVEITEGAPLDGKPGRGTVHHVAFRAAGEKDQEELVRLLADRGYHLTGRKDRRYFRSVYFHEPGGVLFEIATDGPGFTVDEEEEELGGSLRLPPWLEEEREQIERSLEELQTH